MTPTQTAELESLVTAIRDVDGRFDPALEAQRAANEAVDALTAESEAARAAYETFMWQLKDDPDLLSPALAAPEEAPPVVPVDGPEVPAVDAPPAAPVEAPVPDVAPTPPVEGADAAVVADEAAKGDVPPATV